MRRATTAACLLSAFLLTLPGMAQASPGALDHTFSGDGRVTTSLGQTENDLWDMAIQPDGKIVVVGMTGPDFQHTKWGLFRYNPGGAPDTSFGTGGKAVHDFSAGGDDEAYVVKVLPSGKLLVGGQAGGALGLGRFLANGKPDTSFSGDGFLTKDLTPGQDSVWDIELLSSGKFLVGGEAGGDYFVLRYNKNGGLDTTFGTNGVAITHFPETAFGRELAVQPDGKILETGFLQGAHGGIGVVRLTKSGKPDHTFGGGDGNVVIDPDRDPEGWGIQVRGDGKIVIGGYARNGASDGPYDAALFRLTPSGAPDTTFGGGDGIALADAGSTLDFFLAMAVQKDGKILLAGSGGPSGDSAEVVRFKPGGSKDSSFGAGGVADAGFSGSAEFWGVGIQKDGKIVAAGYVSDSGDRFGVARFLAS